MPLPVNVPPPPKPPPAVNLADPTVLANHLTAVYQWQIKILAALS